MRRSVTHSPISLVLLALAAILILPAAGRADMKFPYIPRCWTVDTVFCESSDGNGGSFQCYSTTEYCEDGSVWELGVYIKSIDSNGAARAIEPFAGAPPAGARNRIQMVPDGTGGCLIFWLHDNAQVYGHRFNVNAQPLWGAGPKLVSGPVAGAQWKLGEASAENGIYLAWVSSHEGGARVMVRQLDENGDEVWEAPAAVQSAVTGFTSYHTVGGESFLAWYESGGRAACQKLSDEGERLWGDNGYTVFINPELTLLGAPDGEGGMYLAIGSWETWSRTLYSQRLNAEGVPLWGTGAPISPRNHWMRLLAIARDGADGAMVTWEEWQEVNSKVTYSARLEPGSPRLARTQTRRIAAQGEGWQVLTFYYEGSTWELTPYHANEGTASYRVDAGKWVGQFVYDFGAARFSSATYSVGHPLE